MPRNSRALLPAEIRSRLEINACGPMLSWASSLLGYVSRSRVTRWPGSRPRQEPCPKARSPATGRGETREADLMETDRHPKSFHQDLSPDSPDDSRVLSDCSDWK
jgi:hypothetical protein